MQRKLIYFWHIVSYNKSSLPFNICYVDRVIVKWVPSVPVVQGDFYLRVEESFPPTKLTDS